MPIPPLGTNYTDNTSVGLPAAEYDRNADLTNQAFDNAALALTGFLYAQATSAATWTITHTLGRKPKNVTVWILDTLVLADVSTPDAATVVITFASPQSGRAQLS